MAERKHYAFNLGSPTCPLEIADCVWSLGSDQTPIVDTENNGHTLPQRAGAESHGVNTGEKSTISICPSAPRPYHGL